MEFEEINTKRLILRKLVPETFHFIYNKLSVPEQIEILGLESREALLKERRKFEKGLTTFNRKFLYFQLLDKNTRSIIGWCGFHTWYIEHSRAEIGYGVTDDNFKNKGFMSEAILPIIEYGFNKMKLNRIEAFISPDNIPSLKLIKKLNFVKEGQLRQHYFKNNQAEDSFVFSLLSNEFV